MLINTLSNTNVQKEPITKKYSKTINHRKKHYYFKTNKNLVDIVFFSVSNTISQMLQKQRKMQVCLNDS